LRSLDGDPKIENVSAKHTVAKRTYAAASIQRGRIKCHFRR